MKAQLRVSNKQLFSLATAALVLFSVPTFAQLTSNPLEPGLYDFMKKNTNVILVDDNHMTAGAAHIAYVSPEHITITATVARVSDHAKAEKMIAFFNERSSVGTLTIEGNQIVMTHNVNPKLAKQSEIVQVVAAFNSEFVRQSAKFNEPMAAK
jgi:hypothetical protein